MDPTKPEFILLDSNNFTKALMKMIFHNPDKITENKSSLREKIRVIEVGVDEPEETNKLEAQLNKDFDFFLAECMTESVEFQSSGMLSNAGMPYNRFVDHLLSIKEHSTMPDLVLQLGAGSIGQKCSSTQFFRGYPKAKHILVDPLFDDLKLPSRRYELFDHDLLPANISKNDDLPNASEVDASGFRSVLENLPLKASDIDMEYHKLPASEYLEEHWEKLLETYENIMVVYAWPEVRDDRAWFWAKESLRYMRRYCSTNRADKVTVVYIGYGECTASSRAFYNMFREDLKIIPPTPELVGVAPWNIDNETRRIRNFKAKPWSDTNSFQNSSDDENSDCEPIVEPIDDDVIVFDDYDQVYFDAEKQKDFTLIPVVSTIMASSGESMIVCKLGKLNNFGPTNLRGRRACSDVMIYDSAAQKRIEMDVAFRVKPRKVFSRAEKAKKIEDRERAEDWGKQKMKEFVEYYTRKGETSSRIIEEDKKRGVVLGKYEHDQKLKLVFDEEERVRKMREEEEMEITERSTKRHCGHHDKGFVSPFNVETKSGDPMPSPPPLPPVDDDDDDDSSSTTESENHRHLMVEFDKIRAADVGVNARTDEFKKIIDDMSDDSDGSFDNTHILSELAKIRAEGIDDSDEEIENAHIVELKKIVDDVRAEERAEKLADEARGNTAEEDIHEEGYAMEEERVVWGGEIIPIEFEPFGKDRTDSDGGFSDYDEKVWVVEDGDDI